jgi:poly(beta-D-mannuronate) lyase
MNFPPPSRRPRHRSAPRGITAARRLLLALLLSAGTAGAEAAQAIAGDARELAAAVRRARPGDTVVLRDGEWRDTRIVFDADGTKDAPVTLRAETPGGVVLTGRSVLRIGGSHLVVHGLLFRGVDAEETVIEFRSGSRVATDSRLTECAVIDCNPRNKETNTKWISLYGARNRVDHCYLAGKTNVGTTLVVWLSDQPNDHRIDHNHFGLRPPLGQNGGETIRVGTSHWSMYESRTIVESNLFERCNGEVEIISNKSGGNIYRNNTFLASEGTLTLRHGNRCLVEGNYFLGEHRPSTGGVRIIGEDHRVVNNYFAGLTGDGPYSAVSLMQGIVDSPLAGYFQVKRALVAFNTFVDCANPLVLGQPGSRTSLPPEDVVIANNVFLSRGAPILRQPIDPVRITYAGNVVYGAPAGAAPLPGARVLDPRLVQANDGLWRPAAHSPLRGTAAPGFDAITHDIDGQRRNLAKDVGCDEVSDEPIVWRRVGPAETGPSWLKTRIAAHP